MMIKNENLFRALVCATLAVLFTLLAQNSIMSSGILLFQLLFVIAALYFSLLALSHAAHFTNERYEGTAAPVFDNENLSNFVSYLPFAVLFSVIAITTVSSSAHVFFKAVFILIALYTLLSTLAYLAFYTNDYFDENAAHAA